MSAAGDSETAYIEGRAIREGETVLGICGNTVCGGSSDSIAEIHGVEEGGKQGPRQFCDQSDGRGKITLFV